MSQPDLSPLTPEDFGKLKSANPAYYTGRWPYMEAASRMASSVRPRTAMELGPYQRALLSGSDVMDRVHHTNGLPLTQLWDATKTPWPISDKSYDLFVALQVWEHLNDRQPEAFSEASRISRHAVLSFPYKWESCPPSDCHFGITDEVIARWTNGHSPAQVRVIETPDPRYKRMVCLYHF